MASDVIDRLIDRLIDRILTRLLVRLGEPEKNPRELFG